MFSVRRFGFGDRITDLILEGVARADEFEFLNSADTDSDGLSMFRVLCQDFQRKLKLCQSSTAFKLNTGQGPCIQPCRWTYHLRSHEKSSLTLPTGPFK